MKTINLIISIVIILVVLLILVLFIKDVPSAVQAGFENLMNVFGV